jgi:hypothetical protein
MNLAWSSKRKGHSSDLFMVVKNRRGDVFGRPNFLLDLGLGPIGPPLL